MMWAPFVQTLGEALLRAPDKGAAASLMPTGMTTTDGQHILNTALFEAIFTEDARTLGPAIAKAKMTLWANGGNDYQYISKTFLLFGDPAMALKIPIPQRVVGLAAEQTQNYQVALSWNAALDANGDAVDGSESVDSESVSIVPTSAATSLSGTAVKGGGGGGGCFISTSQEAFNHDVMHGLAFLGIVVILWRLIMRIKARRSGRRSSSESITNSAFEKVTEYEFEVMAEPDNRVVTENVSSKGREQEISKMPEDPPAVA